MDVGRLHLLLLFSLTLAAGRHEDRLFAWHWHRHKVVGLLHEAIVWLAWDEALGLHVRRDELWCSSDEVRLELREALCLLWHKFSRLGLESLSYGWEVFSVDHCGPFL